MSLNVCYIHLAVVTTRSQKRFLNEKGEPEFYLQQKMRQKKACVQQ